MSRPGFEDWVGADADDAQDQRHEDLCRRPRIAHAAEGRADPERHRRRDETEVRQHIEATECVLDVGARDFQPQCELSEHACDETNWYREH